MDAWEHSQNRQEQPRHCRFISFAGSTRPLEDVVFDQIRYVLSLDRKLAAEAQQTLKQVEQQVAAVKSPALSECLVPL